MRRPDVEKRMRALACYLAHDQARVIDDLPAVGAGARRLVNVALRQRELARDVRFTVVPTAGGSLARGVVRHRAAGRLLPTRKLRRG
jgi:hypothetical protein